MKECTHKKELNDSRPKKEHESQAKIPGLSAAKQS
jgi:hypothetical protein